MSFKPLEGRRVFLPQYSEAIQDGVSTIYPHHALSPASGAAPDSIFPFLRLPAELRNRIYALALTLSDEKIEYVTRRVTHSITVASNNAIGPQTPASTDYESTTTESIYNRHNQLQYVCKELHWETQWLELLYNPTIIFRSKGEQISATEQFLRFVDMVPANKRHWIRTVELYNGEWSDYRPDKTRREIRYFVDSNQTLYNLADLCRRHPFVTVRYQLVLLDYRSVEVDPYRCTLSLYICMGIKYCALIRGAGVGELWPEISRHYLTSQIKYLTRRQNLDVARLHAPSLRFFPMNDTIPRKLFKVCGWHFRDAACTQSLIPSWVHAVRGWLVEGI
jgi:hypothetical protein